MGRHLLMIVAIISLIALRYAAHGDALGETTAEAARRACGAADFSSIAPPERRIGSAAYEGLQRHADTELRHD